VVVAIEPNVKQEKTKNQASTKRNPPFQIWTRVVRRKEATPCTTADDEGYMVKGVQNTTTVHIYSYWNE
jgi:hypothetical protein